MHVNRSFFRTVGAAAAAIVVVAMAAGCGDDTSHSADRVGTEPTATGSPSVATHNQADITFAQDMIPHHQQAVQMSEMARTRAEDPEVKALAADIEAAQAPEIETMTTWLTEWGVPLPSDGSEAHGDGHGNADGHGDMPGMMTDQDMAALSDAHGDQFDRMFLEMMISHHIGAVEMAETELQQGQNPDAKALAEEIRDVQNQEIALMRDLLAGR